jgi:hypothetical protein
MLGLSGHNGSHGEIDRPDRQCRWNEVYTERPSCRQKITADVLHRTNTKSMIQETVGHGFITPIGGLFFSTYHKAMSFFSNTPTHLPEEP